MELIGVSDTTREIEPRPVEQLEAGNILFFARSPRMLSEEDSRFLLGQRQSDSSYFKNIAYRPADDRLTGAAKGSERERLRAILRKYSQASAGLLARLLPRYAAKWRLDFTSFRPFEEAGRKLSLHSRNDLLHVDAFPTRPTNGSRILRFFTNLNPSEPRVWMTTDGFASVAERFAGRAGLEALAGRATSSWRRGAAALAHGLGLRQFAASPYDTVMHRFHNLMKEDAKFQEICPKKRIEFPPGSSWLVFTDSVSHAVLSGQFALEQTFIVPAAAQARPELAPVSILEKLAGGRLTWPN